MYPVSPSPKKTLVGLPVRNIDYGSLHRSLRVSNRDVKRNLQPGFIETLDRMCQDSSPITRPGVAISHHGNKDADVTKSPLIDVSASHQLHASHQTCSPTTYCGICRKRKEDMTHYGIYHQDDTVDLVMGGVIDRIDHLIDRLGKGGYDKKEFKTSNKENKKNENVGIILPCDGCAVRAAKRYSHVSCQTEEPSVELLIEELDTSIELPSADEAVEPVISPPISPVVSPIKPEPETKSLKKSSSSSGIYTEGEDDNTSVLSSDDEEFSLESGDPALENVPSEVQEYEIAAKVRREVPEIGTTETVHFRMMPYKNLYVWGHKKYIGTLPPRVALRSHFDLNYHITVFKNLTSDRPDIRLKRLKELVTARNKPGRGSSPASRTVDSSKLGNLLVIDIPRYSKMGKRGGHCADKRIPVVNLRDGHSNRLWLSERVSDVILSRSPRLRFAIELAKSNRAHWKLAAKDLSSNQRPYRFPALYSGKSFTQFYVGEMKRFVTKPLTSRCLVYYCDLYEDNTKDHVKSKTYVGHLGNIAAKDSKSTPIMQFNDRIKEHVRAGQKLYDPKVNIFNVALQNPSLSLDEPGKFLPQKSSNEITKCPNAIFIPLDFGFSSWSKPTTVDHLAALKQAYCDVFSSNGPAGYNI